jgi:hypothetical protein
MIILGLDPDPYRIRTGIQQQTGYGFGSLFSKIPRSGSRDYGSETLVIRCFFCFDRPKDKITCLTDINNPESFV